MTDEKYRSSVAQVAKIRSMVEKHGSEGYDPRNHIGREFWLWSCDQCLIDLKRDRWARD